MRVGEISLNPMNATTREVDSGTLSSMTIITTASPAIDTIPAAISVTPTITSGQLSPPHNHLSPPHQVATSNATAYDPDFVWGNFSGFEILTIINKAYDEIVQWRQNLPTGTAGNSFVQELAHLLQAFADGSSLECVSMKTVTILQALVLQKPSRSSKTRDHICHLKRRMKLWKAGNINEILLEGRCIQEHLPESSNRQDKVALAKSFQNLMSCGKVNKALRLLSSNSSGGVLGLDEVIPDSSRTNPPCTTREILIEEHPPGKPPSTNTLLQGSPMPVNPIPFENLNAEAIRTATLKTNGAADLSGLDAHSRRRLCSSFKSSNDLCTALACVGKCLCTTCVNPDHLSAFIACRSIPLDKCPGVKHIGMHWGDLQKNSHQSYSYPIEAGHPGCHWSPSGLCRSRKWM